VNLGQGGDDWRGCRVSDCYLFVLELELIARQALATEADPSMPSVASPIRAAALRGPLDCCVIRLLSCIAVTSFDMAF
jgi:hypothetical protein